MTFRCVIFAAVSTPAQATDDRASIPSQVANARALIERRGWKEVHDPLIVPGQSRSIDWLHEAIAEIPAIEELINLSKTGEIDLVVIRDYDRLSRTRTLLTQISTYLGRCDVQIYATDKPVDPVPPGDRRRRGYASAATIEAFAALEAEQEVSRIVQRRYYGMNAVMRRGLWHAASVPYGYTRDKVAEGHPVLLDVPEIVPEQAAIIGQIENLFLDEGMGLRLIAERLNSAGVPWPGGAKHWTIHSIRGILINPFYCGMVIWGLTRSQRVYSEEENTFKRRHSPVPSYGRLVEQYGRELTLDQVLRHRDELEADDVVIAQGAHEPLRTIEQQRRIDGELETRNTMGGRAASTRGSKVHVLTGLLRCGHCGSAMIWHAPGNKKAGSYYRCAAKASGKPCESSKYVQERAVLDTIATVLFQIATEPGNLSAYVQEHEAANTDALMTQQATIIQAIENLSAREKRWADAYESNVIDLQEYGKRLADLRTQADRMGQELREIGNRLKVTQDIDGLRGRLRALTDTFSPEMIQAIPASTLKTRLRGIIERIEITDGQVSRIILKT
ncbi:MAG: recombinase family protein [Anaerolineae bacterium]|nr:recombinase family protein [Anaerolineae bacterium]